LACALALATPIGAAAAPVVVIVAANDDAAVRAGLEQVGVAVEAPGPTRELIDAAAGSGIACEAADAPCWVRVAKLSGYDTVVVGDATRLLRNGPDGVRQVERLAPGPRGTQAAITRLFGRAGAVIITTTPPGASISVDGGVVEGGVADGLTPGQHAVDATLDGYTPVSAVVVIEAGGVAREAWTLTPSPRGGGTGPILLWGGAATAAAGLAVGVGLGAGGWFVGGCEFEGWECKDKDLADAVTIAGLLAGAALGVVGFGAVVASFTVE
jgi:hypothetical protein